MKVFLGITGASGAPYASRLLELLAGTGCEIGLCVSDAGVQVLATELYDQPELAREEVLERLTAPLGEAVQRFRSGRLSLPLCERLRPRRRLRRLPLLDVERRPDRCRRGLEPDPPRRCSGAQGGAKAGARAARDTALPAPARGAREPAPGRRDDRLRRAFLLRPAANDRGSRRHGRRAGARPARRRA